MTMKKINLAEHKTYLLILGITAIVCSRSLFFFFDDPEGPNLLVVAVVAAVLYGVSLTPYVLGLSEAYSKRFWFAVLIQVIGAIVLYFLGVWF